LLHGVRAVIGVAVLHAAQAKPAKHTAAELAAKVKAATSNVGGGKAGLADRQGGKVSSAARHACFTALQCCAPLQLAQRESHSLCFVCHAGWSRQVHGKAGVPLLLN
jgi:hypothetical protein